MNLSIMNEVFAESIKSLEYDDVPVGAILLYGGEIIARAHNTRVKDNNILGHAEINCLQIANRKLNNWKLYDCDLYVSLEPCDMCKAIINEARIRNVYYLIDRRQEKKQFKGISYNCVNNECPNIANKYVNELNGFFKKMR